MRLRSMLPWALVAFLGTLAVTLRPRAGVSGWPTVERYELEVTLEPPGRIAVRADLELADVVEAGFPLLLNRALEVRAATDGAGRPVTVRHGSQLAHRHHREARLLHVALEEPPPDGRLTLHLEYGGRGRHGDRGPDWMGILLVDSGQVRMSPQTVWYPEVPASADGPGVRRAPAALVVHAPEDLEVVAPGRLVAREGGTWRFESARPLALSLVATHGRREEVTVGDTTVVTLLSPERAALAAEFAAESARIVGFYRERFGDAGAGAVGVVEIRCRGDRSYNWASDGVVTLDVGALRDGVPTRKLAHELAHLWWGQAVQADGPGERFLTEGLAEYSSWRWLEQAEGAEARAEAEGRAHRSVLGAADDGLHTALARVTFATTAYSILAYSKGALVLSALEAELGRDAFDAALAAYRATGSERPVTLDDLRAALDGAAGRALEVPWLEHDGHLELALEDVAWTDGRLTGVVRATPVGGFPLTGGVELVALGDAGDERWELALDGSVTPFERPLASRPTAVELDPDGRRPFAPRTVVVLDGARLVSAEPAPDARDAPVGGRRIVLEFDRPLGTLDLELAAHRLREAGADPRLASRLREARVEGARVELATAPWLPEHEVALPLDVLLRDARGLPVTAGEYRFQVAPSDDRTPPRVVATDPPDGATDVPLDATLSVTFSEPVQDAYAWRNREVRRLEARGLRFPGLGDRRWDPEQRTVTWTLRDLEPDTRYFIPFGGHLEDLAGNELAEFDLTFTTAPAGEAGLGRSDRDPRR